MTERKVEHTQAPWSASRVYEKQIESRSEPVIQISADGLQVAVIPVRGVEDEAAANARLIAAAPGLLEAARTTESVLSKMLEFWERNGFGTIYADSITIERDRLRAAIRAAEGD